MFEEATRELYIYGAELSNSFVPAFIHVGTPLNATKRACYITSMTGQRLRTGRSFYISSRGVGVNSQDCHVVGEVQYVAEPLPKDALFFDKTRAQYGRIDHKDAYVGLSQFTLNVWIKPVSVPVAGQNISYVEKDNGGGQSIGIYQSPTGKFHCGVMTGGVWGAADSITTAILNRWYMVTLRYDGTTFKAYINGVEQISLPKTGEVTMSADPWYLAHRPNTGHYVSMGITKFKFLNYALTPTEIAGMYKPPCRIDSQPAYVHIQDYHSVEDVAPAFVVSHLSSTNPGKIRSSIGALIPVDAEINSQSCFIASGASFSDDYDMVIDVDDRISLTLDTIIFVRGGQTFFPEYKIGNVEYPITRKATRPLKLFTKQVPGTDHFYLDCHIMTHFSTGAVLNAFINTGHPVPSIQNAFISGPFTSLSDSQSCLIIAGKDSTLGAYVEGGFIPTAESEKFMHVVAEGVPAVETTHGAFINAAAELYTLPCFIPVAEEITGGTSAYVVAETTYPENSSVYLYIGSAGQIMRPRFAYIDGVFYYYGGPNCYIVTNPVQSIYVGAMVMSSIPRMSTKRIYLRAGEPKFSGQNLYIHSNLWLREGKPSFIRGLRRFETARNMYIHGSKVEADSHNIFMHGLSSSRVTTYLFIHSKTVQSGKLCYITSIGGGLFTKRAYIRNVGVLSNLKVNSYLRGGVTLNPVKRAHIHSVGNRRVFRRAHITG